MKKIFLLSILFATFTAQVTKAALVVENLDLKVNAANPTLDLKFSNFQAGIFSVNYFAVPGSVSFIGKVNTEFSSTILAEPIGGGNYTPIRLYNNSDFTDFNTYFRQPIFLHNNNLTFTNNFKGKGNQYMGARIVFPMTNDTMFIWFLVNLNAAGDEFSILKVGYDDSEFGKRPLTGLDGENKPTTGMAELMAPTLNVYPQPAKDLIQIEINADLNAYSIYALNGQLIETHQQALPQISVAHLERGIYILELNSNKGIIRRKVVIE
ncbi:MAG: T9SS type A sorting domain-containing protein [Bacteroidia bacterium]